MPKTPKWYAAERVDLNDLQYATDSFPKGVVGQVEAKTVLDKQSRIFSGFQVELADQTSFPGRIIVHAGYAEDRDGNVLFNPDQLQTSRTVTLEGANTTFFVEVELAEVDADVDSRAFWDPTVDQGTDTPSGDQLPDGQEFNQNLPTRKSQDWRVVTPIAVDNFAREKDSTSTKIPLVKLTTDGAGQITSVAQEKAKTTLLKVQAGNTTIRVQNIQLFKAGDSANVGAGAASTETKTILSVDPQRSTITFTSALSNTHTPGEIIQASGASSADVIVREVFGRYRRDQGAATHDYRDRVFQGDEIHGDILLRGFNSANLDERSDLNLESLKDYVDTLAAKLQEMQWGVTSPYIGSTDVSRAPPGITATFPVTPRYFDRSGGIQGARAYSITVGDGNFSFGDFNAPDETSIQAALDNTASGSTVYVKRGSYTLNNNLNITKGVKIVFDPDATILRGAGYIDIQVPNTDDLIIHGLKLSSAGGVTRGIHFNTTAPRKLELYDCEIAELAVEIDITLPRQTLVRRCEFRAGVAAMNTSPLIDATGGVISGVWESCYFSHLTVAVSVATAVDAGSINNSAFVDCIFQTTPGLFVATSQVRCANTGNAIDFSRCKFSTLVFGTTKAHIFLSNASNVRITGCVNEDALNRLVQMEDCQNIEITGCRQLGGGAFALALLDDTANVAIRECQVTFSSGGPLSATGIKLITNSFTFNENITIENNHIKAVSDNCTGIFADIQAGGALFTAVTITNNFIEACQVGMYFAASGGSGGYTNIQIEENTITDTNVSLLEAQWQKLGILVDSDSTNNNWAIRNNFFNNLNPDSAANPSTIVDRAAIAFGSSLNSFDISGNEVLRVGNATTVSNKVAGIYLISTDVGTLEGNKITEITGGINAYGMLLADSGTGLSTNKVVVLGNNIGTITSDGGIAHGIHSKVLLNSSIADNTLTGISNGLAVSGYGISTFSNTLSSISALIVSNNRISVGLGASVLATGIHFPVNSVVSLAVKGNTIDAGTKGIYIEGGTGTGEDVQIEGNTIGSFDGDGIAATGSFSAERWTIRDNHVVSTSGGTAVSCVRCAIPGILWLNIISNTLNASVGSVTTDGVIITGVATYVGIKGNSIYFTGTGVSDHSVRVTSTVDYLTVSNNNMVIPTASSLARNISITGASSTNINVSGNQVRIVSGTTNLDNIYIANVVRAKLSENLCVLPTAADATCTNILLSTGCILYTVSYNTLDVGGSANAFSINTSGTAATSAAPGIVAKNLVDGQVAYNATNPSEYTDDALPAIAGGGVSSEITY